MSKLRTYSKNQKTIDNPNIFTHVDSNKMDISFENENPEPVKATKIKRTTKKEKEHEPQAIEEEPVAALAAPVEEKKSSRTRKQPAKENEEPQTAAVPIQPPAAVKAQPKRKTKSENKENKTDDEQPASNSNNKQKIKLFQSTDSETTDCMPPPPTPSVQADKKERGRPATKGKENKLRSASSASNLMTVSQPKRATTKAAEKQPETEEIARDNKKLAKSSSVSNLVKQVDTSMETEETSSRELRSIMKNSASSSMRSNSDTKESASSCAAESKPKRGVKILEKIDDRNDQLENLKIDNKTKHSASTSTPSGTRRRPLKAPQDVSMICKS